MEKAKRDEATARVRDFYDGPADTIYRLAWGENLHLSLPGKPGDSRHSAMAHTTERMAGVVGLDGSSSVLDLGSGYGGPARQLVRSHGCRVTGLNLSGVEIEEAERQTRASGLGDRIEYVQGDFHELPFAPDRFDVVWSQDSLMYGADKPCILREAYRVLRPGGVLDFTDILASRTLEPADRSRLYERVRTPEMWDVARYLEELLSLGFAILRVEDWSEHVAPSYAAARAEMVARRDELTAELGADLVARTLDGLSFWVDMAEKGLVGWALFVARKPLTETPETARASGAGERKKLDQQP